MNWDSAGQARYIINACVFLVDIQGRFGGQEPTLTLERTDAPQKTEKDKNKTETQV